VIGFDDIHFAAFTEPPLTTVALSRWELAESAFSALMRHIEPKKPDQPVRGEDYTVVPALIIRQSTAEPRASRGFQLGA